MRTNRVIALIVATLVSTAGFAGAQATGTGTARAQGKAVIQRAGRDGLLRGVSLSAAEKAKVKEIRAQYRTEVKALHEKMKPALVEARAARQKGDTAAVRAVLQRTKADRETARELRTQHIAAVRSALSAENQKAFDANLKLVKAEVGKRANKGRRADGTGGRKPGRGAVRARPNG